METETVMLEDVLNHLLEISHDDRRGFQTAAESVSDPTLKQEFLRYSSQRSEFINDLDRELRKLGETPTTHGTVVGAMRRGWMHLASVVTGGDEHAILSAVLKAQQAALETYTVALEAPMTPELQDLIANQHSEIARVRNHLQSLCDVTVKD